MASPSSPLPSKEAALFRQVVKFYESKQYKKAIKSADQILKKFAEHGETLAMKGLTLNYMDRKEEAYDLVRRGLKADLRSHVCWHVYGLLHRSDNNYLEAIKCYMNALRLDKDNVQILRDLAMLQIQMRDIPGFVETRYRLLQLRANNRNHWISWAIGHHLDGNHDLCVQILSAYESTLDEVPASEAYEHSEMLAYKASVLAEGGQPEAALSLLEAQAERLKDRLGAAHAKAELLLQLGRAAEAEALYRGLLALNADDYRVHEGLHLCLGITPPSAGQPWAAQQQQAAAGGGGSSGGGGDAPAGGGSGGGGLWSPHSGKKRRTLQRYSAEERAALGALYEGLRADHPKSLACARIPLDFLEGDAFVCAADGYVRRFIERGVPSLFSDLRPLLADPAKAAALLALFEGYADALRSGGALPAPRGGGGGGAANGPAAANGAGGGDAGGEDSPLTWVLHYLAQHHDAEGRNEDALAANGAALELAPGVIELQLARRKILKHCGDLPGAALAADAARRADLADRYTNSMAVAALFAARQPEAAEATALLFTRDGDQANNLYDMQHMWYEVRAGDAHLAAGALGKALKKYAAVAKHFADFAEDQFDFHSYCVRKMTLRAYVALLRMEDRLHHHPAYMRAALGAVRAYLALVDAPAAAAAASAADEAELAALSPEERKKEKLRRRKEEKRREREADAAAAAVAAAAAEAAKQRSSSGGGADKTQKKKAASRPPDPDPDGAKLAATADPLGEATKYVVMLTQAAPQHLEVQLAAAEVYGRKARPLLEAAAVRRARDIAGPEHPDVHRAVVRFAQRVSAAPPANPAVAQLVGELLPQLLGGAADAAGCAAAFSSRHGSGALSAASTLRHRAAAAEMAALLDPATKPAAVAGLLAVLRGAAPAAGVLDHGSCVETHRLLLSGPLADAAAAGEWRAACAALFPRSAHFGGAQATPSAALVEQLADRLGEVTKVKVAAS
ncbi:NAA15 [Scenedesmus sp. PABB004]|nr:NAA15 [Scenedesmus sp. PABB004]